ncbi:GntR family transcriptional regulator [Rhodopseudomonas palustris]|nr:GntR family transcriptional regulator [Rhodopseudomonas palustris]
MSSVSPILHYALDGDGPRSLTSAVQERIRADILATRLLPGQKLHIAGLAKQFSVSLAAVREALSRLVADGLVQAADQRGFRVSPVSLHDLADVTRSRIEIEGLMLRRSIELGDEAWLNAVEAAWSALKAFPHRFPGDDPLQYDEWAKRHNAFHLVLVSGCDSPWLLRFRKLLHEQSERYRRLSIRRDSGRDPADVEVEHAAIVEAVIRRDAEAAIAALAKHFTATKDSVAISSGGILEADRAV